MIARVAKTFGQRAVGRVSAALSILGNRATHQAGILCYHRIAERTPGVPEPTINVTPSQFRRQLVGLLRRGYQFWSLTQLLKAAGNADDLPPHVAIVTFDDGYECVYTSAFPVLEELGIPATVFVNTAYLDAPSPFPFDRWGNEVLPTAGASAWRPLSFAQCRAMIDSGLIEIGAHTHTHDDFRSRPAEFATDMAQCLAVLRDRLALESPSFAFPFGRWRHGYVDDALLAAARASGVSCALTTECELVGSLSDPFGWGRFNIYDWDSAATIAARLRGWYGWAPRWQDRLATLTRGGSRQKGGR